MKVKFYLFSILLLCGISLDGWGQVSYNKRAMGAIGSAPKAGNFLNSATLDDVDKSTGTLKLSIPLYEIKVNDISVPITLNYTATGLKVGQEAGVAGMGWELNTGGKIITNVQGKPDDAVTNGFNTPTNRIPEPFIYQDDVSQSANPDHKKLLKDIIDGKTDNAWDTYSYVLPNGGGTYTSNGLTYPYDPLVKIDHVAGTISTTDGLVYSFTPGDTKKTTKIIRYPTQTTTPIIPYTDLIDHDPAIWYDYDLYKITSTRFKDVVNFKYKHIDDTYYPGRLAAKKRTSTSETLPLYRDVQPASSGYGADVSTAPSFDVMEPIVSKSVTEYTSHSVLDTIDFSTGMVVFEYNPTDVLGRDVLKNIRIYKKETNTLSLLKRYMFEYFANYQYGHYLYKIDIYNSKDTYLYCWQFSYNDLLPVIPNAENKAQDRWGFYNGKTNNKTLLESPDYNLALKLFPHYTINTGFGLRYTRPENTEYYGLASLVSTTTTVNSHTINTYGVNYADRSYDFTSAAMGTLVNVTTPTGARYEYTYEPHYFKFLGYFGAPGKYTTNPIVLPGGGIRINSIVKRRGHNNLYYGSSIAETDIKKIYEYGSATPDDDINSSTYYNSIGRATIPYSIVGNLSAYFHQYHTLNDMNANNYDYVNNMLLLSHPINNLVQYNGSYVMYNSVTEKLLQFEGSPDTHGKTVYYSSFAKFNPFAVGGYNGLHPAGGISDPYGASGFTPYLSINMGITPEDGAGLFAIDKYSYKQGVYRIAERTKYEFEFYPSPQNSTFHLVNTYAALTGQLSGLYPSNPSSQNLAYNPPVHEDRGGTIVNTFAAANESGFGGTMDFITKTYLIEQGYTEDYPGKYDVRTIDMNTYSYCMRKTKEQVTTSASLGGIHNDVYTKYVYGNPDHMLPTIIYKSPLPNANWDAPRTDTVITHIVYPQDYNFPGSATVDFMKNTKMGLTEPIVEYTTYKSGNPLTEKVVAGTINTFKLQDNAIVPDKVYKMTPSDQQDINSLPNIDIWNYWGIPTDSTFYKPLITYDYYVKGQLHQYTELKNKSSVVLYGYHNQFPIAKVTNVGNIDNYTSADVAYTSFEVKDTCNWIYAGMPIADSTTVSGKKVYDLSTGSITKVNGTASGKYIVSYWYKAGATVTVTGGTVGAPVIKTSHGPWILAEQEISAVTGVVTVSGAGYIDELRFHPKESQMTTYLYDPLIGLTCTIDANGRAQYNEYDDSQRLKQVKDHNGNIVKAYYYLIGTAN